MSNLTDRELPVTNEKPALAGLLDLSVIIVSYNTRDVLCQCLRHLHQASDGLSLEVIVVDNASRDGSVEMLEAQHPDVSVIRSESNLGFGVANNRAMEIARGRYIVLLNSDAFLRRGALRQALQHMDAEPQTGLGGGRLVSETESWQPSARRFPSLTNDFFCFSGLADRFPRSRWFGRADRTWADPMKPADVDWVPAAFSILRPEALTEAGGFDETFFLYYEEVDLCRRIQAHGYKIRYWPDVVVVHLGGQSSKAVRHVEHSNNGSRLPLWTGRSRLLYYRKHHGSTAYFRHQLEVAWHFLRKVKNSVSSGGEGRRKVAESQAAMELLKRAWRETRGGRVSPAQPW